MENFLGPTAESTLAPRSIRLLEAEAAEEGGERTVNA